MHVQTRAAVRPAGSVQALLGTATRALQDAGDLRESRKCFDAAFRVAELEGDGNAMAAAALGLSGLWVHEHRTVAAAVLAESRLRQALAAVPPDSPLAFRLRARIVGESDYRTGGHAGILALAGEARRGADPIARAETVSLAHHCLLGPEHAAVRGRLARELIEVSRHTKRRGDRLMGTLWYTVDLLLDADPRAGTLLAELRGLLGERPHLAVGFIVRAIDVMLAIRAGSLEQAEHHAAACAEAGTAAGDADATAWHGAQMVAIRWYQGRLAELLPTLRELVNSSTLSAVDNSMVAALAVAAADAGDHRQATAALARLGGSDLAGLPRSASWLATMYGVVEATHTLRRAEPAAAAYELLSPFARLPMVGSLGAACFGSVQLALGTASLTTGHVTRAVEHLREAVRANQELGHRPATAFSHARLAHALTLRAALGDATDADALGDAAEAARALDLARREAAALGLVLPGAAEARTARASRARLLVVCRRRGQQWRVDWGQRGVLVEHSIGVSYLAALLGNPGQDVSAAELAAGPGQSAAAADTRVAGSSQPVLDEVAGQAYRRRIARLRDEIDEHTAAGRPDRVRTAHAEREWLIRVLNAATGMSGRTRSFATRDERARIAVGKAIRRAMQRISALDPVLGAELHATVRMGRHCRYQPR